MSFEMRNVDYPVASEQNSESCGTTTQKKRKASTGPESPRKRQRCARGPAQLASEAAPAKRGKRKASTERGTPEKKLKCEPSHTNSSEAIRGANWTEQDNAEKLLASETPGSTNRERACDPSPDCSTPSASIPDSGSAFLPFTQDRARFEATYKELHKLGEGGFGSVYAGLMMDSFPVAIKHIAKEDVEYEEMVFNGKTYKIPLEVLLMQKVGGEPLSVGTSPAISMLDYFELEEEVLLIMERPVPCESLYSYLENNGGPLDVHVAKNIMKQLVDAAIMMHNKGVFHRDLKTENLLLETGSSDLRVRIIDFGCGCWVQEEPQCVFSGMTSGLCSSFSHCSDDFDFSLNLFLILPFCLCIAGTSAYAPPEFFTRGTYEAIPTTVWQLGALLYEMLYGVHQFRTTRFVRKKRPFNKVLHKDCRNFLKQCLTRSPQHRATLEQIQQHPWLQDQTQVTP
ncbi:serine/threonine-protein kinase pim-2-like isoform X1 [Archocentrus centrarchus]|uniref:serine/threonine-protein kinase pim-2-like isoform X1 n=2 Tax=Archocentrus centrarchus TaxID=63155 RepID=UPI0011EA2A18|nr:serine/threonine-protein kinase pim-2-like isoform X1 [Archocentrus centrarchus]